MRKRLALRTSTNPPLAKSDGNVNRAKIRDHELWANGAMVPAVIYDRALLLDGDVIPGPAIVVEMDSTTLIEAGCVGTVDHVGNILINPVVTPNA